jgi:hypothetical protein
MSYLTIFTAPKPFSNPHIATIQRNAITSWVQLGRDVEIILLGNDHGIKETAAELGVHHIAEVKINAQGTPLIGSMFDLARKAYPSQNYMIINTDIIVFPEILDSIKSICQQVDQFLIVGQRWDLEITHLIDFSAGWKERFKAEMQKNGRLHPRGGSDYFIFPERCYKSVPDFAIGRAGWDNWMIYEGRLQGWRVIDATNDIQILHQNHDYSHLPGGKPHYKLPETFENVRMAGGERTIFTLVDTDSILVNSQVKKSDWEWHKFWREVEIFPLIRLKSYTFAQVFYVIFHPIKAYRDFRTWLRNRSKK